MSLILSTTKLDLVSNPDKIMLNKNISPVKSYKVSCDIIFEESKHWIIYDFVDNKIFSKSLSREFFMISGLPNKYKNPDGSDMNDKMEVYLSKYQLNLKFECNLKNISILAILDNSFDNMNSIEQLDRIFYCIYHTYTNSKSQIINKSIDYIRDIKYNTNNIPRMNWVWFRKTKEAYLKPKVIERVWSWINLNPELDFHLWTNLENNEELLDFMKDADPSKEFINHPRVFIHYCNELMDITEKFCIEHELDWSEYKKILNNYEDNSVMVFKTDSLRCLILSVFGGWYADFNDTYCFVPLKYIMAEGEDNTLYFGCDEKDCLNNYLLYAPKNNLDWIEKTKLIISNSIKLYTSFYCNDNIEVVNIFNEIKNEFCQKLKECITRNDNINDKENDNLNDKENDNINDNKKENILLLPIMIDLLNQWERKFRMFQNNYSLHNIQFNDKTIINMLYIIFKEVNNSLNKQLEYEMSKFSRVRRGRRKKLPSWKENPTQYLNLDLEINKELKEINDFEITPSLVANTLVYINVQTIMKNTNIGCIYTMSNNNTNNKNNQLYNIKEIPYCYTYDTFTFLTSIGHLGDGTCTGMVKDYTDNLL